MKFNRYSLSFSFLISLSAFLVACGEQGSDASSQVEVQEKPVESKIESIEEQTADRKPLDLSVPEEDLSKPESISQNIEKPQNKLPDLFASDNANDEVSVGGGVLRDDANPDLVDSVQGAEVSIEMKTN